MENRQKNLQFLWTMFKLILTAHPHNSYNVRETKWINYLNNNSHCYLYTSSIGIENFLKIISDETHLPTTKKRLKLSFWHLLKNGGGPYSTAMQCREDPWQGIRVKTNDPSQCPKIRLKEPGPNRTSAGFQTDENRYYTSILAVRREAIKQTVEMCVLKNFLSLLMSCNFPTSASITNRYFIIMTQRERPICSIDIGQKCRE